MTVDTLVSVVCTVYNKAPWLEQTLNSFLEQEADFLIEILVIDDASTDSSAAIIERYASQYPDRIRAFYNEENLGIAKTWVKVCAYARGKYIARCDGDDFWIDRKKLQKQVDLLAQHPQARWSNTDFDIYNEHGEFVSAAGFERGTIPLADSFEKMLATRGFTMASTWLVERELMLEVNSLLDVTTSDDTFNLQLDLFQRTELTYLPEATVAYVINQGSDSRPKSFEQIEKRFAKLLSTQNTYLDQYPQSNYREMLGLLLERSNRFELELVKQSFGPTQIGVEQVTIYFDVAGKGFSEESSQRYPLQKTATIAFTVPPQCHSIRVDLSEKPSFYKQVCLRDAQTNCELVPNFTNGIRIGERYLFLQRDPQIIYNLSHWAGRELVLTYEMFEMEQVEQADYIGKVLAEDAAALERKVTDLTEKLFLKHQEVVHLRELESQYDNLQKTYASVIGSRRWIIPTKIINFFRRKP